MPGENNPFSRSVKMGLTLSMLGKNFRRRHFDFLLLFVPKRYALTFRESVSLEDILFPLENRLWYSMQIVFRDNLHEISKPVFWERL